MAGPEPVQRLELPLPASTPRREQLGTTPATSMDPAAVAVATGLATRAADGSVVFNAFDGFGPPPESPLGDSPSVQRQAEPAGPVDDAPAPAPGPAPPAAGAGGGQTNEQLEELAKRLYDKIRERLKAELRLDRERSGRLADVAR